MKVTDLAKTRVFDEKGMKKMLIQFVIIMMLTISAMILVTPLIENLDAQLDEQTKKLKSWKAKTCIIFHL